MKYLYRFIIFFTAIFLYSFPICCYASQMQIEAVGSYVVGDGKEETPTEAKHRAKQEALRIASDRAGIYVESYSHTENMQITEDEIRTVASEIISIIKESYDVNLLPNYVLQYTARITAVIDTDSIQGKLQEERERFKQMERESAEIKEKYNSLKSENEKLKAMDQSELSALYQKATSEGISATEKLEIANEILRKDASYRNGAGYLLRGMAYGELQKYEEALASETKYLAMNPNDAYAYYYCALDYQNVGDIRNALIHIDKAISLEPDNWEFAEAKEYIRFELQKKN